MRNGAARLGQYGGRIFACTGVRPDLFQEFELHLRNAYPNEADKILSTILEDKIRREQNKPRTAAACSPQSIETLRSRAERDMDAYVRPKVVDRSGVDAAVEQSVAQCRAHNAGRPTGDYYRGAPKHDCGCLADNMRRHMLNGESELRARAAAGEQCIDRAATARSVDQVHPDLPPKVAACVQKEVANGMETAQAMGKCRFLESRNQLD
jgi:hypothetical protein